jgi:peptide/nickel transport system substrate-binding protein
MRRAMFWWLGVLGGVALLWAGPAGAREGELTVSQKTDVETLDQTQSILTTDTNVIINVFDTLVRLSDDGKDFVPELAESWKVLNPTTWQFKLRKGVKFHNGEDFNAEAAKHSFDIVLDPERKARQRPTFTFIKEVRVDDPYTITIVTNRPYAIVLTELQSQMMVPPRYTKDVGLDEFGRRPVGTGPFKFKEWQKDVRVVLEANDQYWKGKPKVQRLIFKPIPEDSARIAALQRGETDIIEGVTYDRVKEIEAQKDLRITTRRGQQIYIGLDTLRFDPFKKVEVRQAMNYAVDADAICKNLLLSYCTRLNGPFFPTTPGYDSRIKPYPYDPERAKKMFAQAGYPNGFDVEFSVSPNFQGIVKGQEVAEVIVDQLRKVGVRAKLNIMEPGAMTDAYAAKKFQMYMFAWKSNPESGRHLPVLLHSKTRGYYYQSPEADKLLDAYFAALDLKERTQIGLELHKFLYGDAPWIYLYQEQDVYGVRKAVSWEAKPDYLMRFRDVIVK